MIQCQGCTCAGWLWEGKGGLDDHQPGVYVPLKALFLVATWKGGGRLIASLGACPVCEESELQSTLIDLFGHKNIPTTTLSLSLNCQLVVKCTQSSGDLRACLDTLPLDCRNMTLAVDC